MSKTLVILAHPDLSTSRANKTVTAAIQQLENVTIRDLYALYPTFEVDVAAEQAALVAHEHIVLQFPFYWYSSPALLKEWLDRVWAFGFAFGPNGTSLRDKKCQIIVTTGSPSEAYTEGGSNKYRVEELLRPLELTANLCKMQYEPPFVINAAKRISDEVLDAAIDNLIMTIKSL